MHELCISSALRINYVIVVTLLHPIHRAFERLPGGRAEIDRRGAGGDVQVDAFSHRTHVSILRHVPIHVERLPQQRRATHILIREHDAPSQTASASCPDSMASAAWIK